MSFLLVDLPGKVKTVLDRLTAARATNLDDLDTTISSRAAAATALSDVTWTAARAAKLDNLDALVSLLGRGSIVLDPDAIPRTRATVTYIKDAVDTSHVLNAAGFWTTADLVGDKAAVTVADTYVTICDVSGKGFLAWAIAPHGNSATSKGTLRITIDGGTPYVVEATQSAANGALVFGAALNGDAMTAKSETAGSLQVPGAYSDFVDARSGDAKPVETWRARLLVAPEAMLAAGYPVLGFASALKVESKASVFSATNEGDQCAAAYVLR